MTRNRHPEELALSRAESRFSPFTALIKLLRSGIGYVQLKWTGKVAALVDGRLYRGPAMRPAALRRLCERRGIRTVIDLRREPPGKSRVSDEAAALETAGIRHVHIPSSQVPPPDAVERFLEVTGDESAYPLLVHCTHGRGRTGLFCAIYRMEHEGWTNDAALAEAQRLGGTFRFGIDERKGRFIAEYVPRSQATTVMSPSRATGKASSRRRVVCGNGGFC
jgi:protein tyrosine phosphatase (PTP) superfamily phosphohydrolase (DUF442 family)